MIELNFVPRQIMLDAYENAPASYRAHKAGGLLISWFLPLTAVVLVIVGLLKVVLRHTDVKCYWCVDKTFEFMFYSLPLRFMLLTFLPLCIVSVEGELWTQIYCPIIAASVYTFFIYMEPYDLNLPSTQRKFSTLYQDIKVTKPFSDKKSVTVLYTPFFLSTRMLFVVFMAFGAYNIFMLQLFGAVCAAMWTLCHLVSTEPHKDERMTNLEIFNTIILLMCFYLLVAFSPYMTDSNDQYNFGWFFIALLFLLYLVNIGQVIFAIFEILQDNTRRGAFGRAGGKRLDYDDEEPIIGGGAKKGKGKKGKGRKSVDASNDSIQFLNAALEEDRKRGGQSRSSANRRSNELAPGQSFDFARNSSN